MADIMQVKAAIIGGGPAGISCGIQLQKQGISNCVIDREIFPRRKTCAGLVTDKTYRLLRFLLSDEPDMFSALFCHTVSRAELYGKGKLLASTDCCIPYHMVFRSDFDFRLTEIYRKKRGLLLEGQKNYSIDYDKKIISLGDGSCLKYEYLVFADGALSKAHRDFDAAPYETGFCIETFIPVSDLDRSVIEMHFGHIKNGYIWVFPYGDRVSVGIGSVYRKGIPYLNILKNFISGLGRDPDRYEYYGAFLPFGEMARQEMTPYNVLMIGDAGGFVDPIFGEGLFFAVLSGMKAAACIQKAHPKAAFIKSMKAAAERIQSGRKLQKIIYTPCVMKFLIDKSKGHDNFLKYYCDRQISAYQYRHTDPRIITDYFKNRQK